jgi:hypothetical protein
VNGEETAAFATGAIFTSAVMTNSDEVMQATTAFLVDMVLIGRSFRCRAGENGSGKARGDPRDGEQQDGEHGVELVDSSG